MNIKLISTLALFLGISGIICNAIFYSSIGTGLNAFFYAIIGVLFDLSKFALIGLFVLFWVNSKLTEAIFSITSWVILSFISLVAAYGFLSIANQQYESLAMSKSNIYEAHQSAVDSANTKVDSLSQFANSSASDQATNKKAELENQLDALWSSPATNSIDQRTGKTVRSQIGNCPGSSWYHKKYCPQVESLQATINEQSSIISGYSGYLAAVAYKEQSVNKLASLNFAKTSSYHPVFENASTLLFTSPNTLKAFFLGLTALTLELLASLLIYLRASATSLLGCAQSVSINNAQSVSNVAQTVQSLANTEHALSAGDGVYESLKADLSVGKTTNLSFKSLQKAYKVTQQHAKVLRDNCVRDNLARYDATKKLVII